MSTSQSTSIRPQFQTIDGLRVRYADSGGSQERTILLTSPWPESIYAFARMWAELAEHARLYAVDLPGLAPRKAGRM
jgi:pimeloyl-ACP methyl ester carboxylesterase